MKRVGIYLLTLHIVLWGNGIWAFVPAHRSTTLILQSVRRDDSWRSKSEPSRGFACKSTETNNAENTNESIAPMYITIGPPLSGKTTWLRSKSIVDVSLDDQPGVYVPLPTNVFYTKLSFKVKTMLRTKRVYGKSLMKRIQSEKELSLVAKRSHGKISAKDFASSLERILAKTQATNITSMAIECYQDILSKEETQKNRRPETSDLFVREALFCPCPQSNLTGIDAAEEKLASLPPTHPVAWANTNIKPANYRFAIEIAQEQNRRVVFVVYNPFEEDSDHVPITSTTSGSTTTVVEDNCELPPIGLEGLLRRNLQRYLKTGRYIPIPVLVDMNRRTKDLLVRLDHELRQKANSSLQDPRDIVLHRDDVLKDFGLN